MARYTIENEDTIIAVEPGPLTTATYTNLTFGIYATGNSKVNVGEDVYDEMFGIALATSRAIERAQRKIQRKLIQSL